MKIFLLVLIVSCSASGQTAKPAHKRPTLKPHTEAEKCWKDVTMYAALRFSALPSEMLADAALRSNECVDVLKAYPVKSAFAARLTELALTSAALSVEKHNASEYKASLVATEEAKLKSEKTIEFLVSEYNKLTSQYQTYVADSVNFAAQVKAYLDSESHFRTLNTNQQQAGVRGFLANVFASIDKAAKVQAIRPTINCTSNTLGNTTYTDCR